MRLVAAALGGGVNQIEQPGSGILVAQDVDVLGGDHVHDHEGFDFFQRAIFLPLLGQMARAVEAVGIRPLRTASSPSVQTSQTL